MKKETKDDVWSDVYGFAKAYNKKLTTKNFQGTAVIVHHDLTYMSITHAHVKKRGAWIMIFSEHHLPLVYHKDEMAEPVKWYKKNEIRFRCGYCDSISVSGKNKMPVRSSPKAVSPKKKRPKEETSVPGYRKPRTYIASAQSECKNCGCIFSYNIDGCPECGSPSTRSVPQ